jgi:hypothetical protein
VLFFDVPEEIMEQRLLERAKKDGANARSDDNIEVIKKRFKTFQHETMPVVDIYRKTSVVWTIGANRPISQVYEQVKTIAQAVFLPAIEFHTSLGSRIKSALHVPAWAADRKVEDSKVLRVVMVVSVVAAVALAAGYLLDRRSSKD